MRAGANLGSPDQIGTPSRQPLSIPSSPARQAIAKRDVQPSADQLPVGGLKGQMLTYDNTHAVAGARAVDEQFGTFEGVASQDSRHKVRIKLSAGASV